MNFIETNHEAREIVSIYSIRKSKTISNNNNKDEASIKVIFTPIKIVLYNENLGVTTLFYNH